MKIKSFTKKAICVALLAGASVSANAIEPPATRSFDLGAIPAGSEKPFVYEVPAVGGFIDYLEFSLPANGGTVTTLFASDFLPFSILKLTTVTLIKDPNGVPASGDEDPLFSFLFSGTDKFKSFNYPQPLPTGSYYLKVDGIASGVGPSIFIPASPEFPEGLGPFAAGKYQGSITILAAPIPEPESYAMFLAGLGLMGVIVRRRTRSQS